MITSSAYKTPAAHRRLSPDLEAYLEAMVTHIMYVSDARTGECWFMNAAIEKVLEYPREQFYAHTISGLYSLVHPEDFAQHEEKFLASAQASSTTIECRVRHARGNWVWMEARLLTTFTPEGQADRIIGTWVDITDRKVQESFLMQEIASGKEHFFPEKVIFPPTLSHKPVAQDPKLAGYQEPKLLSVREIEVLRLVAKGYSSKMIADTLHISWHTANSHRKNILAKLNARNTAELVNQAARYL